MKGNVIDSWRGNSVLISIIAIGGKFLQSNLIVIRLIISLPIKLESRKGKR